MDRSDEPTSGLKSIPVPGGVVTYKESGEGVPIIAVHGMPGNYRVWRAMEPELTTNLRVVSVNLPGFEGTSIKAGRGYGQKHIARFLSSFTEALGLEKYFLMAHSWAGAAVIHLAVQQRSVMGLVLFASVGPRMHRGWKTFPRPNQVSRLLWIPGMARAMRGLISKSMRKVGVSESTPYQELLHAVHYAGHLDFRQIERDVRQLHRPTFIVWSEDDRVVDSAISSEMSERCPEGPRLRFSKAGHNPHNTRAREVGQRLRPWVSRVWGR